MNCCLVSTIHNKIERNTMIVTFSSFSLVRQTFTPDYMTKLDPQFRDAITGRHEVRSVDFKTISHLSPLWKRNPVGTTIVDIRPRNNTTRMCKEISTFCHLKETMPRSLTR